MGRGAAGGRGRDAEGSGGQLMAKLQGCTACGYITCRCVEDQTNWKTLDEIGVLLMKAIRKLSVEERNRVAATLLEDLRKPGGKLGRKK